MLSLHSIANYKRSLQSFQSFTFIFWYISSPASVSRTISTQKESVCSDNETNGYGRRHTEVMRTNTINTATLLILKWHTVQVEVIQIKSSDTAVQCSAVPVAPSSSGRSAAILKTVWSCAWLRSLRSGTMSSPIHPNRLVRHSAVQSA